MRDEERQLREKLLTAVKLLEDKGFNHASTGNLSCRDGDEILITPTGGNSGNLTPGRIVRLTRGGKVVGEGIPSSEWHMHTAILGAFPHANAVVHTHADACVALSCLRRPIPAFHYMVAGFGGVEIRCARYATFGTADLATSAVEALQGRTACLLANHGMIAMGKSLDAALAATIKLETLARQYLLALSAGEPVLIDEEEMSRVGARYGNYGVGILPG
ncbi:class II aldolase/adducin family protein [Aquamicrobium sp. LC103]|nr:class II aldolase/adducin family protein [Aquamicrobium sp. LC103]